VTHALRAVSTLLSIPVQGVEKSLDAARRVRAVRNAGKYLVKLG